MKRYFSYLESKLCITVNDISVIFISLVFIFSNPLNLFNGDTNPPISLFILDFQRYKILPAPDPRPSKPIPQP